MGDGKHTLMESFLLFKPLRRLPLGSLDSEVSGFPFFKGSLTKKMEKAAFPALQMKTARNPARTQRIRTQRVMGYTLGGMFVFGRL